MYKTKFKEYLSPLGFILYRKTFYRIVNDVVQTLMLNNQDNAYTVHFGITPLFIKIQNLHIEGHEIHHLRKDGFMRVPGFICGDKLWYNYCPFAMTKLSTTDGEKVADEMLDIIITHVFPILERGNNCMAGSIEMRKYYEFVCDIHDIPLPANNDILYISHYCYIKLGEYENAIALLQKRMQASEHWKKFYSKDFELLTAGNIEYFDKLFAENEAKSREYLSNPRKYKQEHGAM